MGPMGLMGEEEGAAGSEHPTSDIRHPTSKRVRPGELARAWCVSTQTIRNYVNGKGGYPKMPVAGEDGGGAWFDLAACQKWKSANRPGLAGRGGKRMWAGAKRKRRGSVSRAETPLADVIDAAAEKKSAESLPVTPSPGHPVVASEPPPAPRKLEELDPVQRSQVELREAQKRDLDFKHEKERGEYVRAAEVGTAVREAVEGAARIAERMPVALATEIQSQCGLDPASKGIVERLCGSHVERMMEEWREMGKVGAGGGSDGAGGESG